MDYPYDLITLSDAFDRAVGDWNSMSDWKIASFSIQINDKRELKFEILSFENDSQCSVSKELIYVTPEETDVIRDFLEKMLKDELPDCKFNLVLPQKIM